MFEMFLSACFHMRKQPHMYMYIHVHTQIHECSHPTECLYMYMSSYAAFIAMAGVSLFYWVVPVGKNVMDVLSLTCGISLMYTLPVGIEITVKLLVEY